MNLVSKVRAVEKLFKTLEKDVKDLKDQTGIHCVENCIKCCTTSNICATAIEFYPLAYFLYKNNLANGLLTKIEQINDPKICPLLKQFSNNGEPLGCEFYHQRGLICRLFAYNYHINKYGIRLISSCKKIKIEQAESVAKANEILKMMTIGPKASNYYQRLQFIDFTEAQRLYPIGDAIRIAIETVLTYFDYRGKKAI